MGLEKGTKALNFEERWAMFSVEKALNDASATLRIRSVEGYYDGLDTPDQTWVTSEENWTHLYGDHFMIASGLTPKKLFPNIAAITDHKARADAYAAIPLAHTLEAVIYGILDGSIRMDAVLTLSVKNVDGDPLPAHASLTAQDGRVLYSGPANQVIPTTAALGVRLEVTAEGHDTYRYTYSLLQGDVSRTVTLQPTPAPEPAPEG